MPLLLLVVQSEVMDSGGIISISVCILALS